MIMKVSHKKSSMLLAAQAKMAETFFDRLVGLMFRRQMNGFDALLLAPCTSIHTCFMKYDLDILFISKDNKVVKVIEKMRPWRFSWIYFKSSKVLELPAGKLKNSVKVGDEVEIECIS